MFNIVRDNETKLVGKRTIVNLNGNWDVGESMEADAVVAAFDHHCPVPGILKNAEPAFEAVGVYNSHYRQFCLPNYAVVTNGVVNIPVDEKAKEDPHGAAYQPRNYFWYRREFTAPEQHNCADLIVLKARFGSKVWLNGKELGENLCNFTSAVYPVADCINWGGRNEVLIRVGAHPGVLPLGTTNPEDCEHEKWFPGIWDDVELYCYNNPCIRSVQICPKIDPKQIIVETEIENIAAEAKEVTLTNTVETKDLSAVIAVSEQKIIMEPGSKETITTCIMLPDAELWTPETPNLYVLDTATEGDSELNRFGVREVGFRSATKLFYLNNKICYLRGGLITFERWLEDPLSGQSAWDDAWIHKLLGDTRRLMNWNVTKYCLHPVPRKWLDIADEEGLMGCPEFPIWAMNPDHPEAFYGYVREYNQDWVRKDCEIWVRDTRNHPSVIYWSASNETWADWATENVVDLGRSLDMQKRQWINSYNPPADPNDPIEDHPYEFQTTGMNLPAEWKFDMKSLEMKCGHNRQSIVGGPGIPTAHAQLISEYGWLWLTRNGDPCCYLENTYQNLPYPGDSPEERLETWHYLLAGLTEYWRAFRCYAQVQINAWLASDTGRGHAGVVDHFKDPLKLEFHPQFIKYVREAFKPLGVYIDFWKREIGKGEERIFYVMLINDYGETKKGDLTVRMEYEDGEIAELGTKAFEMSAYGSTTIRYIIHVPEHTGKAVMTATARTEDGLETVSRRWVEVKDEVVRQPWGDY